MRGSWVVEDAGAPAEAAAPAAPEGRRERKRKDGQLEARHDGGAPTAKRRRQYVDATNGLPWRQVTFDRDAIHFDMSGFGGLEEIDADDFDVESLRTEAPETIKAAAEKKAADKIAADKKAAEKKTDKKTDKKANKKADDKKAANTDKDVKEPPTKKAKKPAKGKAAAAQGQPGEATDDANDGEGSQDTAAKRAERLAAQRLQNANVDVSAWAPFGLHADLLDGLRALGFTKPTPVQERTLRAALKNDHDVVGSAETGSGKTLAFGLAVLNRLLTDFSDAPRGLKALILTPTRELAMQVRAHLEAVARFTGISVVALVGGMSKQKQSRVLSKNPEICVATPGRLWELITEEGLAYFGTLSSLRFFVLDEADRMIENGHFKELDMLVDLLNKGRKVVDWVSPEDRKIFKKFSAVEDEAEEESAEPAVRRTYVFSATMTLGDLFKKQVTGRKKHASGSLSELMAKVRFRDPPGPEIVDVSRTGIMAASLAESRIFCSNDEKDLYTYYVIMKRPGKYIVFVNSIDCLRRLIPLLSLLGVTTWGLHAQMQQRQRLKNMDRFREATGSCVLVASDVAARGIDIPDVDHVIHYQIPRSAETYVHRSGRTARANRAGTSLMLVGPAELESYKKFCAALQKPDGIDAFPVDEVLAKQLARRVKVATQLDKLQHKERRVTADGVWRKRTAEAMGIMLDDDDDKRDDGEGDNRKTESGQVRSLQSQLRDLLAMPLDRLKRAHA